VTIYLFKYLDDKFPDKDIDQLSKKVPFAKQLELNIGGKKSI